MKVTDFITPNCCPRKAIATMDHARLTRSGSDPNEKEWYVNRVCLKCGKHWYGPVENVKEFTSKEWDSWLDEALPL